MNRNKRIGIIAFSLITIILLVRVTYAFFTAGVDVTKEQLVTVTSGTVAITFDDADLDPGIRILNLGESTEKLFKIENTGSLDASVVIAFRDLVNTYLEDSISYTLLESTSETGPFTEVKSSTNVRKSEIPITYDLSDTIYMPSKSIKYYKVIFTLNDLDVDQTSDLDATFTTSFTLRNHTMANPNLYVLSGFIEKSGTDLTNYNVVVYSDTPHYNKIGSNGYFYIDNLEVGEHEIYILNKDIENILTLSKNDIQTNAISSGTFNTSSTEISLSDDITLNLNDLALRKDLVEIEFDGQNGEVLLDKKYLKIGDTYGSLPNPTLGNLAFEGWYTSPTKGVKVQSIDVIKGNIKLYARYGEQTCNPGDEWTFDYNGTDGTDGSEQEFIVPCSGIYKLETWGAQGGNSIAIQGGYGSYSIGNIKLNLGQHLYVQIGGHGKTSSSSPLQIGAGGYNGGGNGSNAWSSGYPNRYAGGGGGATHISLFSGLLYDLKNNKNGIYIVSGGGGGSWYYSSDYKTYKLGHGGGSIGGQGVGLGGSSYTYADGGLQDSHGNLGTLMGEFGQGANTRGSYGGGGGGYYGGNSNDYTSGGGSGFIGNLLPNTRKMVMYASDDKYISNDDDTRTEITTCVSEEAVENCAKKGNGYVRITFEGSLNEFKKVKLVFLDGDYIYIYLKNNKFENLPSTSLNDVNEQITWYSQNENGIEIKNGDSINSINTLYARFKSKTFDYNGTDGTDGSEQKFIVPYEGIYKLETWGAQGGNAIAVQGGYGSYSIGNIKLNLGQHLYIQIGGHGKTSSSSPLQIGAGGYNGGGDGSNAWSSGYPNRYAGGGGGATHISLFSGLLYDLKNNENCIYIVSGGGGGSWYFSSNYKTYKLGHGGGSIGGQGVGLGGSSYTYADGGLQDSHGNLGTLMGEFGQGANTRGSYGGGGGGYYGGNSNNYTSGGGSGFIGNLLPNTRKMVMYATEEKYISYDDETKTEITTCAKEEPTPDCAKIGHGYARITLVGN